MKEVRAIDERLAGFSFTAEQQILRRLDKAFRAFFERCKRGAKPGFPRYRSKARFDCAEFRVGDGLLVRQQRLRLVGIDGLVRVRWHPHGRTVAQRNDFLHKLSDRLVREHSHIAVEDLNLTGLTRAMLAKDVLSAGWATFFNLLRYKAESAGSVVEAVNPNGTSQACSACGVVVNKTLAVRVHACTCGYTADRDVKAAQNILARASFMGPGIGLGAQSTPEVRAGLAPEAVCFG